jgi:hypothetical protein
MSVWDDFSKDYVKSPMLTEWGMGYSYPAGILTFHYWQIQVMSGMPGFDIQEVDMAGLIVHPYHHREFFISHPDYLATDECAVVGGFVVDHRCTFDANCMGPRMPPVADADRYRVGAIGQIELEYVFPPPIVDNAAS